MTIARMRSTAKTASNWAVMASEASGIFSRKLFSSEKALGRERKISRPH